jgi:hypothetical protein
MASNVWDSIFGSAIAANFVLAAPNGSAGPLTPRALVANDYVTMVGDSGAGGVKGAVPAPASGDAAAAKFLKADGTWAVPAGSGTGTVTSVDMTVPSFLSVSGNPITTSGTLAVTLATETANTVFAGPTSGGAATPTFRALVAADLPAGATLWSALGNASADLTLANSTFNTTFNQTSAVNWKWANTTPMVGVALTLTQVSVSGGTTTYTGTITGGGSNALAGAVVTTSGFATGGNNVASMTILTSTTTTFTVATSTQVNETHAGSVISSAVLISPSLVLTNLYGASPGSTDSWILRTTNATVAANPVSVLQIYHTGSTGVASLSLGDPAGSSTSLGRIILLGTGGGTAVTIAASGTNSLSISTTDVTATVGNGRVFGINGNTFGFQFNPDGGQLAQTISTGLLKFVNFSTVAGITLTPTLDLQSGGYTGNGIVLNSLTTPGAPTITPQGTTGATTYSYKIVAVMANGQTTDASAAGTTTTGNATLTAGNNNKIDWVAVSGAFQYRIYRTVGGATQGLISTVTAPVITKNDTGLAGDGSTAPTVNTTGRVSTYLSVATVSAGIPSEVAVVDLTAQTAAIGATTLYAVPAAGAGMYRISWSATITTAATTGAATSVLGGTNGFQIAYTSPTDSVVKTTVPGNSVTSAANTTGTATGGSIIVYAKASTNIQYSFDYASNTANQMAYELHIKCEAL